MNSHEFAAGMESGAILVTMVGVFFYDDTLVTELLLLLALVLSIWRYARGSE